MPQSLSKNYIHLVFSTHGRADMIPKDRMGEVFSYISAVLTDKGCPTLCVNGTQNHVHILFILSRNTALADAVRLAKNNTSKWINSHLPVSLFKWQSGYGAFSVSQSLIQKTTEYIMNQEEHHRKLTFKDEYKKLLELYKIEYDEQYMWD